MLSPSHRLMPHALEQVRSVQAEIRALRVTQTARAAIAAERNRVRLPHLLFLPCLPRDRAHPAPTFAQLKKC